jgi:hypothetical protein
VQSKNWPAAGTREMRIIRGEWRPLRAKTPPDCGIYRDKQV